MAGKASIENGMKGGRPKGSISNHTKDAIAMREYILQRVSTELDPMITAMIHKVKSGDVQAFKELLDRALGKAKESIDVTSGGEPIKGFNYITPHDPDDPAKP